VLGVERVGRDQSFFDLRGDSLQAARLAGRLIEEVPEAGAGFFDEILRQVLERPTIGALAEYLTDPAAALEQGPLAAGPVSAAHAPAATADARASAGLIPLGGMGADRYLLMHDATGGLSGHPRLLAALRERGAVWGVPGEPLLRHLEVAPHLLIDRLVADTVAVVPRDQPLHLAGYRAGGVLALELARQLAEAGVDVRSLTIAEPLAGAGLADDIGQWFTQESGEQAPPPEDPDRRLACLSAVLAAAQEPQGGYVGDVTLILPPENLPGQPDPVAWWAAACLGEVRVHRPGEITTAVITRVLAGGGRR
jgi:pyochelin synthetase